MKLSARLLLWGALLPAGLLVGGLVAVGIGLEQLLRQSVDRALLAQAAVESVSLFDRPDGAHLHVAVSPLPGAQGMTAWAALYGPDGHVRMKTPVQSQVPDLLTGQAAVGRPQLSDQAGPGPAGQRVLVVGVPGPDDQVWRLRLAQPLEVQRETMLAYAKAAALVGLLVLMGLLTLQIRFGHNLNARIEALARHLRRLHHGDLDHVPAADAAGDVLSELRDLAESATRRLQQARADQQRLVADAAHELRTPLAVLRTDVDVTLRRERPPEQLREALERARDEVDRLAKLANDLLELATLRRAATAVVVCDAVELVRMALQGWQAPAGERGIELRSRGAETLTVRVEPAAVRQVLDNLLGNAMDFAPKGSIIEVVVAAQGHGWRLSVRDHGPGVPEAQRATIFAPFHRLDRRRTGSGLGLAIVAQLAERHGGRAWVEAAEGGGARFVVTFGENTPAEQAV